MNVSEMQLTWIVLHGGGQLSPTQQQATAGNLQVQWKQLTETDRKIVSQSFQCLQERNLQKLRIIRLSLIVTTFLTDNIHLCAFSFSPSYFRLLSYKIFHHSCPKHLSNAVPAKALWSLFCRATIFSGRNISAVLS